MTTKTQLTKSPSLLYFLYLLAALLHLLPPLAAEQKNTDTAIDYIHLSPEAYQNLNIQLVASEETDFERTLFAIGSIQSIPNNHSVVSTRIAGRIQSLKVIPGDSVKKGELLGTLESSQPGSPPPVIPFYAPTSGVISQSHIRLGDPITPEKKLLDIIDLTQVWATARIPQKEAASLSPGTQARILISALGNKPLTGELIRFGTAADPKSGTLDAIFLVQNLNHKIRPGMRAEFSIITSTRKNVTVVPKAAVQGPLTERVIFIQDYDLPHSLIKSPVITGEENDRYIEIVKGLFPGDQVVTTGAYLLNFAGAGNTSLKEALDAAHGHEHNEDGSEITEDPHPSHHAEAKTTHGHPPHDHHSPSWLSTTLIILLVILLILSALRQWQLERKLRGHRS